jgi:hypothetical protein
VQLCPVLASANQSGGEDHRVECDIVLSHKLEALNVVSWLFPPLLPLIDIVCGDGDIADRRIEPDIEYLVLELLERYGRAPLEVPGDAPSGEALVDEGCSEGTCVLRPETAFCGGGAFKPLL